MRRYAASFMHGVRRGKDGQAERERQKGEKEINKK
jgi:hypothetical protein